MINGRRYTAFLPRFPDMHFKLICLYRDGVLIDKDQLADEPTYTGNLVIEDWVEGSVFKRPVRHARLLTEDHSIPTDIIPPLFEPTILKMTANQMTLQGHQIGTRDGASVHYIQSWVVRMTSHSSASSAIAPVPAPAAP